MLLAIITVVFAYLGWSWRPQSSGFPTVPQGVMIRVDAANVVAREVLTETEDHGATLDLFVHGDTLPDGGWSERAWQVTISDVGSARLCTPEDFIDADSITKGIVQHATRHRSRTVAQDGTRVPRDMTIRGEGFPARVQVGEQVLPAAFVRLCWEHDAPVEVNGSYLSARFPPVHGGAPAVVGVEADGDFLATVSRVLHPETETGHFAIQSQPRPTSAGPDSWEWAYDTNAQPILVSAVDVSDTQHADYLTFLSGIALGLAGAAVIALFGEFILPLHQRREERGGAGRGGSGMNRTEATAV